MTTHYGIWTDGETTAHLRNNVIELTTDETTIYLTTLDLRTILEITDRLRAEDAAR